MKISILVPVFNEEKTIELVLEKLLNLKLDIDREVIVIDDGSTDKTREEIAKIKNRKDISTKCLKVIFHKKNMGKGAAVQSGIKKAKGDYILIQDADLEYDPAEIPKLLKPILDNRGHTIAVYGSRFMDGKAKIPFLYLLGNKCLTLITNLLCWTNLTDMETGYKVIPAEFFKRNKLYSTHFDIEPEITVKLIKDGVSIVEAPISYKGRSKLAGKKLTPVDALEAIRALVYFRYFAGRQVREKKND